MSELIDSVFDVSKISKEVDDVKKIIKSLETEILGYSEATKKLMEGIRSSKDFEALANSSKKLNDNISGGKKATDEYMKQIDQLAKSQEKLNIVNSDRSKALLKNKQLSAEATAINKAKIIIDNKEAGTIEKLTAQNKLLAIEKKKLNLETAEGAKRLEEIIELENKNNEALKVGQNEEQKRTAGIGQYKKQISELVGQFKNGEIGTKQLASGFVKLGKQMVITFITNPVFLAIGAIVLLIKGVADAFGRSEDRSNKLKLAMANFQPVLKLIGDGFEVVADIVIKTVEGLGKAFAAVSRFLNLDPKSNADKFVEAEKLKQDAIIETRKLNEDASIQQAIVEENTAIVMDKVNFTYKERQEALKKAGEAQKQLAIDRQQIAEMNLKALEAEAALDDNNAEMNNKLSAAIVEVNNARKESASVYKKVSAGEKMLFAERQSDLKAEAAAEKEAVKLVLDERRRLIDSQLNILTEGEEKQIAINAENFKRQLEDLKIEGKLTSELQQNLETANKIELQKIRDDFETQRIEKDKADFEKSLIDFENNLKKQTEILAAGYDEKELKLKRKYANGLISAEQYEGDLAKLQSEALREANNLTIDSLQKSLDEAELTADKRAEYSNKLRELQIENENAVLNATIADNDKKVQSEKDATDKQIEIDKAAAEKRKQIASEITSAGMQLFSEIGNFQKQQSENRLAEIEERKTASDEFYTKQQENLDNSIMSDAARDRAQKKIVEDKAKRDKALTTSIQAEKIKQAKWEKAQSLVSAIISNAQAIIAPLTAIPWSPLNLVFSGLAAATGAVQIATIASKKIPAYEKGGITKNETALWGETRPEVAVTRTGDIMFAEKPMISKFDAGTRIYKSVEDYERNMSATNRAEKFDFDYDKMAQKMPSTSINLDHRGLWGEVTKQGNRRTVINRRYKLN